MTAVQGWNGLSASARTPRQALKDDCYTYLGDDGNVLPVLSSFM